MAEATSADSRIDSSVRILRGWLHWETVLGILVGIVAWFVLASIFPRNLMPFPLETLEITWQLVADGTVFRHLMATVRRMFWAFLGTMSIAIILGVTLGMGRYLEDFLSIQLVIALSAPAVAVAAGATIIFGFGDLAPIVTTIIVIAPYLTYNIWGGVENMDTDLLTMARSFDVSRYQLFRHVILPDIAPALFGSSRNGLAHTWRLVTLVEIFASSTGLGFAIIHAYEAYRFQEVWAWIIIFIIIILFIEYVIFKPLERRIFAYRPDADFPG